MIRRALFAGLISLLPLSATAQEAADPTFSFQNSDEAMNAAIAAAQDSLPQFLENTVDDEGFGPAGGYLKVRVPVNSPEMENEIIWVGPFLVGPAPDFVGLLSNQPVAMPGLNRGDRLDFSYDMIVDWSLHTETGQSYGDYTTRVIVEQMPPEDAAPLLERFIVPPVPAEW